MEKNQTVSETGKLNLHQKLVEVRKSVPYLKKDSKGHQYNYTSSSQVLGVLRPKLDELGLYLKVEIIESRRIEGKTAKGAKEITTELDIQFTWVNADNPSDKDVHVWYGQGVDNQEKGVGKALTYAEKYFLLKVFNIPTDNDDPDRFNNKIEASTPNFISSEQVNELQGFVNEIASLRNVPSDSVLTSLEIKSLGRVENERYMDLRKHLLFMVENAKNDVTPNKQEQPQQQQQQQQQKPEPEPVQEGNENNQPSNNSNPVNADVVLETFTLVNFEEGMSGSKTPFTKLFVTTNNNVNKTIIVKGQESKNEVSALLGMMGQQITMYTREENNFVFFVKLG